MPALLEAGRRSFLPTRLVAALANPCCLRPYSATRRVHRISRLATTFARAAEPFGSNSIGLGRCCRLARLRLRSIP